MVLIQFKQKLHKQSYEQKQIDNSNFIFKHNKCVFNKRYLGKIFEVISTYEMCQFDEVIHFNFPQTEAVHNSLWSSQGVLLFFLN